MSPRNLLPALVAALLPVGLWSTIALPSVEGGGGAVAPPGGWAAVALAGGAALAIHLAYRRRTGRNGPGLAAACAFSCFPALPDAMASGGGLPLLGGAAGAAVVLLVLGTREGERSRGPRFLAVALGAAVAAAAVALLAQPRAAAALFPVWVLLAPGAAVLAGEATGTLLRRTDLSTAGPRWLLLLLALVLGAGAVDGVLRGRSWGSPRAFWERAVAESPSSPAALGALAGARAGEGDVPGCGEALRRFVEAVQAGAESSLSPAAARPGAEGAVRGALLLLREGAEGGGGGEIAVAALDAAHGLAPDSPVVLRGMGERRLVEGSFVEAVRCLEEAVSRDSSSPETWDALARALIAASRIDGALGAAQRATGLDPSNRSYTRTYADALLAAGRNGEALTVLMDGLGKPPYDPEQARAFSEAHRQVAEKEISAGRSGRARRLLAAGLQVDPSNAACQDLKRDLDRRYEEERPAHEALMAEGPDGAVLPDNLLLYAAWLCRWGEFEEAWPLFKVLLDERGGTAAVHFQVGQVFWEGQGTMEGYGRAVLAYRDALARDPGYVEARNRLWQVLNALGRREEAAVEARRFLEEAPTHPDSFDAEQFLRTGGGGR